MVEGAGRSLLLAQTFTGSNRMIAQDVGQRLEPIERLVVVHVVMQSVQSVLVGRQSRQESGAAVDIVVVFVWFVVFVTPKQIKSIRFVNILRERERERDVVRVPRRATANRRLGSSEPDAFAGQFVQIRSLTLAVAVCSHFEAAVVGCDINTPIIHIYNIYLQYPHKISDHLVILRRLLIYI